MTQHAKQEYELYLAIYRRAKAAGIAPHSQLTHILDIENASRQFDISLEKWLAADDFNFIHDFCGIRDNINRETGKVEGFFVPRFSGQPEAQHG